MRTKDCRTEACIGPIRPRVCWGGWPKVIAVSGVAALLLMGGDTRVFAAGTADGSIGGLKAKFTEVDEIRTRYYEYGQGEPMILIHGGFTANSSTANVFSRNILGLAEHYHVFAMDRLACGLTGNPRDEKDYSAQGDVDFIYDFIKTMKLGQVHLVGHSAGGGIAMDLAIEHPEIVKTLTIIAAGPEDPPVFSGLTKLTEILKKCPDQSTYAGLKCRAGALAWLPDTFEEEYWSGRGDGDASEDAGSSDEDWKRSRAICRRRCIPGMAGEPVGPGEKRRRATDAGADGGGKR
jgi:pimeloyl-ACP methyl ester carboxylesterase